MTRCDQCGDEAPREQNFKKVRASFSTKTAVLCSKCVTSNEIKLQKRLIAINLLFLFFSGMISVFQAQHKSLKVLGWPIFNMECMYLVMLVMIVPHELGHLLAAKCIGFRVFRFSIGKGKTVFEKRKWGINFDVRELPVCGLVVSTPKNRKLLQFKCAVYAFGGLAINCLFALMAFLMIERTSPQPEEGFFRSLFAPLENGFHFWNILFIANVYKIGLNLWPRRVQTVLGKIPNDGLNLLNIFLRFKNQREPSLILYYVHESWGAFDRKYDFMEKWAKDGLSHFPNNHVLRYLEGMSLIHLGKFREAHDCCSRMLRLPEDSRVSRSVILNNTAYAAVMTGDKFLLDEADRFSEEALKNDSENINFKGTRGTVLVEMGKIDEGILLLEQSIENENDVISKAANLCHLAIAERKRGNMLASRRYREKAESLDPKCLLLKYVEG
jgi:tetratricopeptide (TPR) repeat protein